MLKKNETRPRNIELPDSSGMSGKLRTMLSCLHNSDLRMCARVVETKKPEVTYKLDLTPKRRILGCRPCS